MEADLDRLGGRQQGLFTYRQLRAAGWGRERIRHACDTGALEPYPKRPGVYRVRGAPITLHQAWMAAVLAARGDVVLADLSAVRAWGFPYFRAGEGIHLLTDSPVQTRLPGVMGHRTLWLPDHDRTRLHFIPITTVERTFIDVCGRLDYKGLE